VLDGGEWAASSPPHQQLYPQGKRQGSRDSQSWYLNEDEIQAVVKSKKGREITEW